MGMHHIINCFKEHFAMGIPQVKSSLLLIPLVLLGLGLAVHTFAESTIKCHCFQERIYNPADRFAADDYILATSFNSLLARSFAIPHRQIILLKMREGVDQEELLIGLKITKVTGTDLRVLLSLRRENKTWAEIILEVSTSGAIQKDKILGAIMPGMPPEEVGTRVAHEMIREFYQVPPEQIEKLSISGLNEKQMALVFILSYVSDIPPEKLVEQYEKMGRSWSEISHNLGLEPKAVGGLILEYPAKNIFQ
jgi:hypothetical protein